MLSVRLWEPDEVLGRRSSISDLLLTSRAGWSAVVGEVIITSDLESAAMVVHWVRWWTGEGADSGIAAQQRSMEMASGYPPLQVLSRRDVRYGALLAGS